MSTPDERPRCPRCGMDYCICFLTAQPSDIILRRLQNILEWQVDDSKHPLACGNDSKHNVLIPIVTYSGDIHLRCRDCDWLQTWVPIPVE